MPLADMLNDADLIRFLWDTGHFRDPQFPDTHAVNQEDLAKLTLDDRVTRDAVASLQGFDGSMELLSWRHHSRPAMFDGDVGPATRELATLPRCGCPDFATSVSDEATGSGSWPAGCIAGYEGKHAIRVDVKDSSMPSHYQGGVWDSIKTKVAGMYGAVGLVVLYVPHGQRSEVDLEWRVLAGSTIGLAEFNRGTCGDNVFHYLDPGYKADLELLTALHAHELGHNCNLQHTRGGIMNPSVLRTPLDWTRDVSYSTLKRFFGGEPIPVPGPPIPQPPSEVVELRGMLYTDVPTAIRGLAIATHGNVVTEYIVTPTGTGQYAFTRKQN